MATRNMLDAEQRPRGRRLRKSLSGAIETIDSVVSSWTLVRHEDGDWSIDCDLPDCSFVSVLESSLPEALQACLDSLQEVGAFDA